MAYDSTGNWKPEDDSVANQVTGLLKPDNPFVMQAKTGADEAANARGLVNSSLAVGAGEKAAIDSVLPIASQDASQLNQKNLSSQGFAQSTGLQGQQIQGQKDIANVQGGFQTAIAKSQIDAANQQQAADIASREQMQTADITATGQRSSDQLASQERIASLDSNTRQMLAQLDTASQQTIANLNISADAKKAATAAVLSADQNYAQEFAAIANNATIPADVRTKYLQNMQVQRQSALQLVSAIYPINIDWSGTTLDTSGATPSGFLGSTAPAPATQSGINPRQALLL